MVILPLLEIVLASRVRRRRSRLRSDRSASRAVGRLPRRGDRRARRQAAVARDRHVRSRRLAAPCGQRVRRRRSGAAVSVVLAVAAVELVRSEREVGSSIGAGIPTWVAQLVLPIGFRSDCAAAGVAGESAAGRSRWCAAAGLAGRRRHRRESDDARGPVALAGRRAGRARRRAGRADLRDSRRRRGRALHDATASRRRRFSSRPTRSASRRRWRRFRSSR